MTTSRYRLLAVLWTAGIILALSIPTGNLGPVEPSLGLDKLVHAILFAGFGGLWLRGLCPPDVEERRACFRWRGGLFFVVGLLFAAATEVYQSLLPVQRLADPYDVVADLVGFIAAFVGYYVYCAYRVEQASA